MVSSSSPSTSARRWCSSAGGGCCASSCASARAHRITSIADLISSRYGKSPSLAVLVTVIALIATTPYIALQLQSLTRSYQVIAGEGDGVATAFWIAAGMALFTILFGTRNLDANERHQGVVAAIALEAVVKLFALLAVGVFATWSLADGFAGVFADVPAEVVVGAGEVFGPALGGPHLPVRDRHHLPAAAVSGDGGGEHRGTPSLDRLVAVPPLPVRHDAVHHADRGRRAEGHAAGGQPGPLRAHVAVVPGAPRAGAPRLPRRLLVRDIHGDRGDDRGVDDALEPCRDADCVAGAGCRTGRERGRPANLLLVSRRVCIAVILGLGFLYFRLSGGSDALAAIGLIAFVGVAQFPAESSSAASSGAGGTRTGALSGLLIGFALWAYTLFLPSFGGDVILSAEVLRDGPGGIDALRPQGLLGLVGLDPLVHAVVWSVGMNALAFRRASRASRDPARWSGCRPPCSWTSYRAAGGAPHQHRRRSGGIPRTCSSSPAAFSATVPPASCSTRWRWRRVWPGDCPHPTDAVVARLERELSGSIGAASAHALVNRIADRQSLGMTELIDIADETQQLIETTRQLAEKSKELEQTAEQLRAANERLRTLDVQKDEFLSQISHELRTPMTSIRSFSEILMDASDLPDTKRRSVRHHHQRGKPAPHPPARRAF